ncbi:acyl carrier protein [Mumia sp. DW29H23]|uniref:acyl carrier protein n=1 Tax=Mumia sp. DW29H23 TaxID=3421241 RepID=UPI003D68EB46
MHPSDASVVDELGAILDQIAPDADRTTLSLSSSFTDDLGLDRLALVQLSLGIEERFGFPVPDADLVALRTVGDAVAYVEHRLATL